MSPVPFFNAGGFAVLLLLFGIPYPLVLVGEALLTMPTNGPAGLVLPCIYTGLGLLVSVMFLTNFVGVGFRGFLDMLRGPVVWVLLVVIAVCFLPALLLWGLYALCRYVKRKRLEADELKRMEIQDM